MYNKMIITIITMYMIFLFLILAFSFSFFTQGFYYGNFSSSLSLTDLIDRVEFDLLKLLSVKGAGNSSPCYLVSLSFLLNYNLLR